MGQCHCLSNGSSKDSDLKDSRKGIMSSIPTINPPLRRQSGNDSGHSSAESLSPNPRDCSRTQRCSQSSESSGKFSFKGSISSPGDPEGHHKYIFSDVHPKSIINKGNQMDDLPVFIENGENSDDNSVVTMPQPSPNLSNQVSPCSADPGIRRSRGSGSSVGSLGHYFFRYNKSSKWPKTEESDGVSPKKVEKAQPSRRAVSLRLPRSRHRKDSEETIVPTVYIEDEEILNRSRQTRRKSSIRQALSLLSLNTLIRENNKGSSVKTAKPVQKILRRPTRRQTVRGISGLNIDVRSQANNQQRTGLHRAHTLIYYPTNNTSLRQPLRPTYSNIIY